MAAMYQNHQNAPNVNYGYAQPAPTPQGANYANTPPAPPPQPGFNQMPPPAVVAGANYANAPPAPPVQAGVNQPPAPPPPAGAAGFTPAAPPAQAGFNQNYANASPVPPAQGGFNQTPSPAVAAGFNYANAPPAPPAQAGVNQVPVPPPPAVAASPYQPAYPAYGQQSPSPIPPYSPQQQYPVSPNDAGNPQPNEAPIVTLPASSPKRDFFCFEFVTWVKIIPTFYLICCVLLLIYFIVAFILSAKTNCDEYHHRSADAHEMSYDKKEKINKEYSYEDHVRCGFGVGGTFGWLVPLLLFNALDVVNAFRVKSVCWFRVSGVIWAIGFVLDTITLLAVTVVLVFSGLIILFFTFVSMFVSLLWVFAFPAIVLLGFYVYALFKAAQIYDYERRNAPNVAAPT